MLQLSVTALLYLEDRRKIHLWGVRARWSKDTKRRAPQHAGERERELALAPLIICFSLPGPVLCKLGQPGVLFVLPEVLTPVSDLPLFYFHGLFPSLSFSHRHFGLLFPILPNIWKSINRGQETGNSWLWLHACGNGSTSLLRATVATGEVTIFPIFPHSHVQAKSIDLLFLTTHPTHSAPV